MRADAVNKARIRAWWDVLTEQTDGNPQLARKRQQAAERVCDYEYARYEAIALSMLEPAR